MSYTEEEIKKYLDILHNYKVEREGVIGGTFSSTISKCSNCSNTDHFTIDSGYKICDECGTSNGNEISEEDYMKELREEYFKLKREEARRLLGLDKK